MPRTKMTPAQYAARVKKLKVAGYRGKQAVQYRIKHHLAMKGVVKREVICGRNILTVDIDILESGHQNGLQKVKK